MKIALLSDIHANLEALRATLADMDTQGVERVVCLGDIVGYHTDPDACVELLRERSAVCVAGNHDRAAAGQRTTEDFYDAALRAIVWTRRHMKAETRAYLTGLPLQLCLGRDLVAVHGALHAPAGYETVRLDCEERQIASLKALERHPSGARICAFGHTHQAGIFEYHNGLMMEIGEEQVILRNDACYLINPGSVGHSRTSDMRATYMLLDFASRMLLLRHVMYDWTIAREKTRKAGLSPRTRPRFAFLPAPLRSRIKRGLHALKIYESLRQWGG